MLFSGVEIVNGMRGLLLGVFLSSLLSSFCSAFTAFSLAIGVTSRASPFFEAAASGSNIWFADRLADEDLNELRNELPCGGTSSICTTSFCGTAGIILLTRKKFLMLDVFPFAVLSSFSKGSILFAFEVIAVEILRSFFGVGGFDIDNVEFSPKI